MEKNHGKVFQSFGKAAKKFLSFHLQLNFSLSK